MSRRVPVAQPANEGAAVRLEMWDAQLAVVREIGNLADIAVLPLDDNTSRFEMTFYVDQIKGLVAVYSSRGRLLEKIQVADDKGKSRAYAMLENHGKKVSLDRFDVYSWDGHLPSSTEYPESYVLDKSEKVTRGSITAFDPASGTLTLVDAEGADSQLPLAELRRLVVKEDRNRRIRRRAEVRLAHRTGGEDNKPADQTTDDAASSDQTGAEAVESDPAKLIEVEFQDSSRLIGYLKSMLDGVFVLGAEGIAGRCGRGR